MKKVKKKLGTEPFFLCLGFLITIVGVSLFWMGFHNVDLGQNMRFLEAEFGVNLVDMDNLGDLRDGGGVYSIGLAQMKSSLLITGLGFFIFGINIASIIIKGEKN